MKIITRSNLIFSLKNRFSKYKKSARVQSVGFKDQAIHDYNYITYIPNQPLQFVNGKALVYQNKRSLFTVLFRSSFYTIPIVYIGYLIKTNPFAAVFPAAIPILFVIQLALIKMFFSRIKWNQNIVKKIQLLENGDVTQIHYANQMKRKLFDEPLKTKYYNSVFVDPDFQKQQAMIGVKLFPQNMQKFQIQKNKIGYSWTKHYSNGQNYLIIPKKANYINAEVLIQIFNGKVIRKKI